MAWDWMKSLLGKKEASKTEPEPKPAWDSATIELKVREIVAEYQNRDISDITLETRLFEESDSIDNADLALFCEDTFGTEIPDEETEHLSTVGAIVKYIRAKFGV